MSRLTRRRFLHGATGLVAGHAVPVLAGLRMTTPRQPAGPFYPDYPEERPLGDDNDLTRVQGSERPAAGQITDLSGRILDRNGRPLGDLWIEIWQCDANGRYRHPRDPGDRPIDPGFQGFGYTHSDSEGRYRFRTIRPAPYPGRTPHIHFAVFPAGEPPFITRLYVAGEPRNASDFLYQRVPEASRHLVTTEFKPSRVASVELAAHWDIVLGITPA
jgi:protocatechuate 3,4-dioxygenase beta subunit